MNTFLSRSENRFVTILYLHDLVNTLGVETSCISNMNHGGIIPMHMEEVNNEVQSLCLKSCVLSKASRLSLELNPKSLATISIREGRISMPKKFDGIRSKF